MPIVDGPVLQFYSKSKDVDDLHLKIPNWRKILSNFYMHPIRITYEDGIERTYPSVEHAFQAAKYLFASKCTEMASDFEVGGTIKTSLEAKSAGGRAGMTKRGCVLDASLWASHSDKIMRDLLHARWEQDETFRTILMATKGTYLAHFERTGTKSYWGSTVKSTGPNKNEVNGTNKLGVMMMDLIREKSSESKPTQYLIVVTKQ